MSTRGPARALPAGAGAAQRTLLLTGLLALALGAPAGAAPPIALEPVALGLAEPMGVTHAGDGSGRLFVYLRRGAIRIVTADGELLSEPFVDLGDRVECCNGEQGLTGLAFHPDYADNGLFYVAYSGAGNDSVFSVLEVSADDPDRADPGSEVELLRFAQPFSNHNAGHIAFGPDGFLYIGAGDGGSSGDPMNNGQDLGTLLGKLLRIDVDGGFPYAIPADNPFAAVPGARGEIWAYGLRNPWRFSFDRRKGDLYIGDVGQGSREEIDFQRRSSPGGENYGWRRMEGSLCFDPPSDCDDGSLVQPILEYEHVVDGIDQGCRSVTGGYRYRGPRDPTLGRFYFFADFCGGEIWGARRNGSGRWVANHLLDSGLLVVSFGEDERGRLYVAHLGGGVYRMVGLGTLADDFEDDLRAWRRRGNVSLTSPGLRGSEQALAVGIDGRGTVSTVRSRQPRGERTFRLSFDLDVGEADLGGADLEILRLADRVAHVKLVLEPTAGAPRLALLVRRPGGSFERVGARAVKATGRTPVVLEWLAPSSEEAADGEATLKVRGRRAARVRDLADPGRSVRTVDLGLPAGSLGAGGGSLRFDNYASTP